MQMSLFNDPSVWRESKQWKAVFGPTTLVDGNSQLLSNFGSISETVSSATDISTLASNVALQFAMDVFAELKDDIPMQFRASRTTQGPRDRSIAPARTPVITPHNLRRVPRFGHATAIVRDRVTTL
jgi:hypothetical protein